VQLQDESKTLSIGGKEEDDSDVKEIQREVGESKVKEPRGPKKKNWTG